MVGRFDDAGDEAVLPLVEELLRVGKPSSERAEVERVPVGRELADGEQAPSVRRGQDGTIVVPVVEEILAIERRLVLRDEGWLRVAAVKEIVEQAVTLRRQRAEVERLPPAAAGAPDAADRPRRPPREQQRKRARPMATRTITAYFDTVQAAEQAARDLATRVAGVRGEVFDARTGSGGLGALPHEDTALLTEGFRRGGGVVRVEAPDERLDAVADALEASGAVDLDEREAQWRREGWAGGAAAGAASSAATTVAGRASASATGGDVRRLGPATDQEAIPIVEERLTVGKREVNRGRVRIRSYVVETPVQEQVALRQEHVEVERRHVDRPVTAADQALFQERVIEATESSEEAVVAKEARVVEEVVVRKEAEERVQTVQDKVRRTEVEVEDDRRAAGTAATGAMGTTTSTTRTPGGPDRR